jgi:transposase
MLLMAAPLRLRLDQGTREAVAERYEQTHSVIERTNCQVVLLADEGRTITEIAWLVRRGREQVRRILHRFGSQGLAGLAPGKHTGRPLSVTPAWQAELQRDDLPEDLPWLLRLLPRADVDLQDEVEVALHPTLTRVWCPKGRRGQRLVEAPGNNAKEYGFGLVDWRAGWFDWQRAPGRRAAPFCAQLRRAVERSRARGRIALVLLDNLGIHTPKGSLKLRALLEEFRGQLVLVYTPP